jgi:uncharacterized protein YidB (DUF937 family)
MLALLGVLAVAGYQNRDKLAEILGKAGLRGPLPSPVPGPVPGPVNEAGRQGGQMETMAHGGRPEAASVPSIGAVLSEGIRDIVDRFRQSGHGEAAESWVAHGPNRSVQADQIEAAIGADTLDMLASRTGLSRQDIVARLARELPDAVDKYTPEGRLPA